uniref:Uncharacterized protein n=1 Tax=Clytia hemisphaerica TaxID=252671 RepID=A0A7M5XLH9_9CNID
SDIAFWKKPALKVYAVAKDWLEFVAAGSSREASKMSDSTSNRDYNEISRKLEIIENKVDESIKFRRLVEALYEALSCTICIHRVMQPPLYLSKCCRQMLGCQQCLDTLEENES